MELLPSILKSAKPAEKGSGKLTDFRPRTDLDPAG
jgi:hypothetical protein